MFVKQPLEREDTHQMTKAAYRTGTVAHAYVALDVESWCSSESRQILNSFFLLNTNEQVLQYRRKGATLRPFFRKF